MNWPDLTLLAGLIIALAGAVRWWTRDVPHPRNVYDLEGISGFVSQTIFWGGMTLVLFGNMAGHIVGRKPFANPWLSLFSSASVLLGFGVQVGRLLMAWQDRRRLSETTAGGINGPTEQGSR